MPTKIHKSVFKYFSLLEGSQHIASENALKGIESLIRKNNIKSVFEFGIGIGTIPFLIKKINSEIEYTGIENNDFCISAFNTNLENWVHKPLFKHLRSTEELVSTQNFDLIIIDSQFEDSAFLQKIVHSNSILFIEGHRELQGEMIARTFHKPLISRIISTRKNYTWSPFDSKSYMGGYSLYRLNNSSLANQYHWMIEKIETAFKYRIRKF